MSTFKTALRMALAHPFYLLIYTVFISLMGVFIAASVSWNSSQLTAVSYTHLTLPTT